MDLEVFRMEDGGEVIHRDGVILAVVYDGYPVELREDEYWATASLLEAVKALCQKRGWPEEAIAQVERSVLHFGEPKVKGVGGHALWGRVPYWDEEVRNVAE
jgi:hypothetical protein